MSNFLNVVRFTVMNKVKSKAFIISTLVFVLLIGIAANLPAIISAFSGDSDDEGSVKRVGYIQQVDPQIATVMEQLEQYFAAQEGIELVSFAGTGDAVKDEELLLNELNNGNVYSYLQLGEVTESGFPEIIVKNNKLLDYSIVTPIEAALQVVRFNTVLQDAGLTDEQVAQLQAPISIKSVQVKGASAAGDGKGQSDVEQGVSMGIVYIMIILLFMAVVISGQLIASEVTAEKSSRVMEVLITSVSPLASMFGKIMGMFLVVIGQIAIYIAVALINLNLPHNAEVLALFDIDLSSVDPMLIIFSIAYFLAGFFLFATLYAALGSIVSRTEDLGNAVMPMTIISLVGFYIAIFNIATPDSLLIKICSYIPLFSPFVMVLRVGLTDIAIWEVLISFSLLILSIIGLGYLSAKVYRTGVLMYGKRPSFKEIRKAMKAYKI